MSLDAVSLLIVGEVQEPSRSLKRTYHVGMEIGLEA